jgi:hypothetical protein
VVEAGERPAPWFLLVSETLIARPAPVGEGATKALTTRSAPMAMLAVRVLLVSLVSATEASSSAWAMR